MKSREIELSIIIPVYKAEDYIRRCLDSIYTQDAGNLIFELIAINDGSPDNSLNILKEYLSKYKNFILINSENKGAGSARNLGLEKSRGKFIWFIDADDFIEPNALQFIYEKSILNNKTIGFNFNKFSTKNNKIPAQKHLIKEPYTQTFKGLDYTFSKRDWYLWICILNKRIIDENNIRFTDNIKNIEDFEFMLKYFLTNVEIKFFNERLYNYNDENTNSTSRDKSKKNLDKLAKDSYIVHKNLKILSSNNQSLTIWLNKSIIGFFISLIKYYPKDDFINYLNIYESNQLLPLSSKKKLPLKYNLFAIILNNFPKILYNIKNWL